MVIVVSIGITWWLYRENGKENGNFYSVPGLYRGYMVVLQRHGKEHLDNVCVSMTPYPTCLAPLPQLVATYLFVNNSPYLTIEAWNAFRDRAGYWPTGFRV